MSICDLNIKCKLKYCEMQYLVFLFVTKAFAEEWVDPHDMNVKSGVELNEEKNYPPIKLSVYNYSHSTQNDMSLVYLKRIISLLVSSTSPDAENSFKLNGKYYFDKEKDDYQFLLKFLTSEKIDVEQLRQLDTILTTAFSISLSDQGLDILVTMSEKLSKILNIQTLTLCTVLVALYIFYYLLKTNYSFSYIIKYFICIILIVDYAFRYQFLHEEAEMHNIKVNAQKCGSLNWFEYLFTNGSDNCEKKIVTPLEVALLQLKHIIIIPLSSIGSGTGQFAKELWNQLPFPFNFIMFPLMLILTLILIPAIMTVLNGQPFKINIMHLFHVQFGAQEVTHDRVTGSLLEKLLNVMSQRPKSPDRSVAFTSKVIRRIKKKKNERDVKRINYVKNWTEKNKSES